MKSKMNIKSILTLAILSLVSFMFLNMSLAANTAKVLVDTANLRETASSDSRILQQVSLNEEVNVLENSGEWCKVEYKGTTGYLKTDLLSINTIEKDETTKENTTDANEENVSDTENVAEESKISKYFVAVDTKMKLVPLINATNVIEVKQDQEVSVLKNINGWAFIEVKELNTRGWIREEKLKTEEQKQADDSVKAAEEQAAAEAATKEADLNAPAIKTLYVQPERVNLRKENNTTSEIVGKIPQNTTIEIISEDGQWSKCRVNGLIGYISTQYLGDSKVEVTTTSRSADIREAKTSQESAGPVSGNASSVVAYARQFLGTPYKYGGSSPSGFDCSGFTKYVYKHFGVNLPRTSGGQTSAGKHVDRSNLAPGDLVCYSGHVAIYVGGGNVIHSPRPGKSVSVVPLNQAAGKYVDARRVM